MAAAGAETMTIGQVARAAGVAASTLRYYERAALLRPATRSAAGYRLYDHTAVEQLAFIRAAQEVGFTLDDIRTLLHLDEDSPCEQIQTLVKRRLAEIDAKLECLQRVRSTLARALRRCQRSRHGCAVLADLKRARKCRGPVPDGAT